MRVPCRRYLRAGLVAASALFLMTLSDKLPLPVLEAESFDSASGGAGSYDRRAYSSSVIIPFDPDSGDGIYSDTREYSSLNLRSFDPDSGDGVYSDTRSGVRYYASAPAVDDDSIDDAYADADDWGTAASPAAGGQSGSDIYYYYDEQTGQNGGGGTAAVAETVGSGADAADAGAVLSDDGSEDLFGLFDDAEDSQGVESAPVTTAATSSASDEKKIDWWGHLNASGGLIFRMFPEGKLEPFATMSNTLGFTAKPFDDFVVRGSFYSEFPAFNFNLTSLYFDYIMNDKLYITAGKTGTAWGNSQIFDTNILDDEGDGTVVNPYTDETATGDRFDAILTLPILKGEIQGVGMYSIGEELSRDNLSFAGKIQYPFGPVSLEVFGRKWATSDRYYMDPAVGLSLTTDLFRNHLTLWGKAHFNPHDPMDYKLLKFVGGLSRIIDSDAYGKFAFAAEYQLTYDPDKPEDKRMTHDIGLSVGWSHMMGSNFSPVVRWWYNPITKQGYILPSLTFTGLRHVDITLTVPYIFGGATYSYGNASWSSTPDEPLVVFGLVFSLSVPY